MIRIIAAVGLMVLLQGCNIDSEYRALHAMENDDQKLWAFLQINVPEGMDAVESYYYFAQISETVYQGVASNQLTEGFMLLENVRYWGNDDRIYDYKDIEYTGEIVFRIEDVKRISLVNKAPVIGMGYEQYEAENSEVESSADAPEEPS